MPTSTFAAGTYAATQRLGTMSLGKEAAAPASGPGSFAAMVGEALQSVSETGKRADAQGMAAVHGKADLVDVVTAVADSEAAVSALVGVRDRVISAYQQIMSMPI